MVPLPRRIGKFCATEMSFAAPDYCLDQTEFWETLYTFQIQFVFPSGLYYRTHTPLHVQLVAPDVYTVVKNIPETGKSI